MSKDNRYIRYVHRGQDYLDFLKKGRDHFDPNGSHENEKELKNLMKDSPYERYWREYQFDSAVSKRNGERDLNGNVIYQTDRLGLRPANSEGYITENEYGKKTPRWTKDKWIKDFKWDLKDQYVRDKKYKVQAIGSLGILSKYNPVGIVAGNIAGAIANKRFDKVHSQGNMTQDEYIKFLQDKRDQYYEGVEKNKGAIRGSSLPVIGAIRGYNKARNMVKGDSQYFNRFQSEIYPVRVKIFSSLDLDLIDEWEGSDVIMKFLEESLEYLESHSTVKDYETLTHKFYKLMDSQKSKMDSWDFGEAMYIWLTIGWNIYKGFNKYSYPIFKCLNYLKYWNPSKDQMNWMKSYDSDSMKVKSEHDWNSLSSRYSDYFRNDPKSPINSLNYHTEFDMFLLNDLP